MAIPPDSINGKSPEQIVAELQLCLATKGTAYYKKIVGGMRCSNLDLLKLEMIIHLLSREDFAYNGETEELGNDCVYNYLDFPGQSPIYSNEGIDPLNTNTYLQTFVDYASRFCKDCIESAAPAVVVPPPATNYVFGEDGTTEITLEGGGHIIL
jgi:hypothetical protein